MKKTLLILAAGILLTGCGVMDSASDTDTPVISVTEPVSEAETTVTVTETETTTETTAAATTASAAAVTEAAAEPAAPIDEYEDELYTSHIEKVPPEEQAALDKLNAKYGKNFTFICREVQWEFIGVPIPEKKPTTYTLEDDEGRRFLAFGTEDSDEIISDNYTFPLYKDDLFDHTRDYIRSYTQAGKLWILTPYKTWLPFEAPAEMTYEEFFSYFCQQEGKIFADILLPEGTELPEELTSFDGLNSIYLDGFGCPVNLGVYYLPQSDYDSLEDVTYGDIGIDRDHLKGANAEIRVS